MNKINFLKNRLLLNYEYCSNKVFLKGYPAEVTIELTNHCNLNCIFCPHEKMRREKGFIDLSLFKEIINSIAGYVECVDLDLMGESTMHPHICEIIRYCKNKGMKTALNSNMTQVDKKLAESLINSGLDILVMSLDSVYKDNYEYIRPQASFSKTKNNIENLLNIRSKNPYKVVQMVYIKHNKNEVKQFFQDWKGKGAHFLRIQPYQNVDKQNTALNALESVTARQRKTCIHPWKKIAVCWDGTVVLCCNDYDKFAVVGDAGKENLLDIWNNALMRESRRKLIERDWRNFDFCRDCYPFEPNKLLLWGSAFVNPVQIRKLLFVFEKLMILNNICFLRYF